MRGVMPAPDPAWDINFLENRFKVERNWSNNLVLRCVDETVELANSCLTCVNRFDSLLITDKGIERHCREVNKGIVKDPCRAHNKNNRFIEGLSNGWIPINLK